MNGCFVELALLTKIHNNSCVQNQSIITLLYGSGDCLDQKRLPWPLDVNIKSRWLGYPESQCKEEGLRDTYTHPTHVQRWSL